MTASPTVLRVRELQTTYKARTIADDGITGRRIDGPDVAARLIAALPIGAGRLDEQPVECFGLLTLNGKHNVTSFALIGTGTLNTCITHPRDVFRVALAANAAAIVVFHNHPSGDPSPSPDDRELTNRLRSAGVLLGIDVLDHVVIGHDGRYVSFKTAGL